MPGNILIVDPVATNRVVMKVMLANACYQVIQASYGAEGVKIARQQRPDLIMCADHLPDMATDEFIRAVRGTQQCKSTSLIVESASCSANRRLTLLQSGANDIIIKPYAENLLLARLRSLLRLRETADELALREGASHINGFAEEPADFAIPNRIAIVAPNTEFALKWRRKLLSHFPGKHDALGYNEAILRMNTSAAPDIVTIVLTSDSAEAGLQLLADLRAKPETRNSGILVLIDGENAERCAIEALDRGANDALTENTTVREISLRLNRLIARKRTLERIREDMRDGLRAALTDPLTGLFNRRYVMPRLAAIANANPEGRTSDDYAVMIIDVDHFKSINDRFGHSLGDTVLTRLANVLKQAVLEPNLLARVGGEEFLVVMPGTGRRAAQMAAKQLCTLIRETTFNISGRVHPLQVTVSIGVALGSDVRTTSDTDIPPHEAVLSRADKALYGAKADGRNQVTLSSVRSAA